MPDLNVGDSVQRLEFEDAWLVDPASGREGRGDILVEDGRITKLTWRRADGTRSEGTARGEGAAPGVVVSPGLIDLRAHLREPGGVDAETIATGLAAAAHGGFTAVCMTADTLPPTDRADTVAGILATAARTGSPVRALASGTLTVERRGSALSPMSALAAAGAVGFSDDPLPLADIELLRAALTEAGLLGRPVIEPASDHRLFPGAEATEGLPATILGLQGVPAGLEASSVARAIAVLRQVIREAPSPVAPRLHLTRISTADSLAMVRQAKAEGLPLTCDVTPHHFALHDGWLGGDRRFTWEVADAPWSGQRAEAAPFDPTTRVEPPLRAPSDALALLVGLQDGTVDAIATDHAPHRVIDTEVAFGEALPGVSGLETALSLVLGAVEAGWLSLGRAVRALTTGPWRVVGGASGPLPQPALRENQVADLVVVDRDDAWSVLPDALRSKGRNTPLLGRRLPGRVLLTVASGRLAYIDPALD